MSHYHRQCPSPVYSLDIDTGPPVIVSWGAGYQELDLLSHSLDETTTDRSTQVGTSLEQVHKVGAHVLAF
jgi:hypothetical protein